MCLVAAAAYVARWWQHCAQHSALTCLQDALVVDHACWCCSDVLRRLEASSVAENVGSATLCGTLKSAAGARHTPKQ